MHVVRHDRSVRVDAVEEPRFGHLQQADPRSESMIGHSLFFHGTTAIYADSQPCPVIEEKRLRYRQVATMAAVDQGSESVAFELVLHQPVCVLMIDRPEYAQQELVIAESVQLPDRRVAQIGKHRHAAISQVELTKVAARTEIQVSPVFPRLFRTTA